MALDSLRVRAIKTLVTQSGMDDDTYREMLRNGYHVDSCTALSARQADALIAALKASLGQRTAVARIEPADDTLRAVEAIPAPAEKEFATDVMQRRLKFHAIPCAIHYTKAEDLGYWCEEGGTGEILMGEELREWMRRRWNGIRVNDPYRHVEAPIPEVILRRMYDHWINPKSNEFLVEGGFKRYTLRPERCYYRELTADAIDYLITRYRAMHAVLDAQSNRAQMPPTKEGL